MRYLIAALAAVTCPCHLPLIVTVLGGTALGATLSEHWGLAFLVLSVLFVTSGWMAIRLFGRAERDGSRQKETR